jgi:RHS repeat-associated protein
MVMGEVVAFVREFVRDLVGELVGRLIAWAAEVAATLGLATPVVVAQATAAISRVVSKVADLVRRLVKTIGNVAPRIRKVIDKLDEIIAKLATLMRKGDSPGSTTPHGPDGTTSPSSTTTPSHADAPPSSTRDQGGTSASTTDGASGGTRGPDGTTPGTHGQGDRASRPANLHNTHTPANARPTAGDPVDVTTGEVVLGQTDVELAGVLPLILRRTHISSYRAGRLYGRSWASTLDQRLEFDEDGVLYVADDGMLLVYPDVSATEEVVPQIGPQWPLRRTDTGYAVSKPESGQVLHFAAGPGTVRPLTEIDDRNGNRITLRRNTSGALAEVTHSGGYHVDVDTEAGLITELRLRTPDGPGITLVRYAYTGIGELARVINSANLPLEFEYDQAGRLTQWTDRNGRWYRYVYDQRGRCIAAQGSGGLLNGTFTYDGSRITRYTNALGHTTGYQFDTRNNVIAETNPLGHTTRSEWDDRDRLISRTDPLGRTTRFAYDDAGRLTELIRPDGTRTVLEYSHIGLATSVIEPGGALSRREYDDRGNVVAVTDAAGALTHFTYDDRGGLTSVLDATGSTRRVETNDAGLVVSTTDALGATTRYQRDMFGRICAVVDPVGGVTRFGWTIEGKLLSRTMPDGTTERWSYDGEGNLIEYRDPLGQTSRTEYGGFDLAMARTGPDGARLEFGYDATLRLLSVTNPQGLTWRYDYDAAGNLASETDFNGRTLTYQHDVAGQLIARTNGAGETTTFVRDVLGNVVEKRVGGIVTTTFGFDEAGRMVHAGTRDAEVEFERDPVGRVLAETVNGRTLTSSYDALGRRTHRRTPSGAESTWAYDTNSNPTALTVAGHTVRFDYDAAGREVRRALDAGAVLAQAWDVNHRLVSQQVTAARPEPQAAHLVQQRMYHYRPDGYVVGVDDRLAGARHFDLDPAGRVTAVHGPGWSERYAYDTAGNVTDAGWPVAPNGAGTPESQGPREYVGTLIRRAGRTRYEHDRQGRLVFRRRQTLSGQQRTWTYRWDADDRLVGVTTPDGTSWRYVYDAFGRRIAKQQLAGDGRVVDETVFTWDGVTLAEQTTIGFVPDGSQPGPQALTTWTTWDFEPGSFRPVSQTERTTVSHAPQEWVDQQFYALVTDLVGTPMEMVDPSGEVAWRSQTTLWGQTLARANGGPHCPLGFPGQYHDRETGDTYNYQRYYDPTLGRYESTDPLGLVGSANPHTYVPNPTTWRDPLGLAPCTPSQTTGTAPSFAVDPSGNVTDLRPGHRPDGQLVLSGHGTIPTGDTSTVTVPPGTTLHMYSPHGSTISDTLGNRIEFHGTATPHETFGPGMQVPDYVLSPPHGLTIMGTPVTVTQPTRLSDLLRPNMGNTHWAACREVYP